MSTSISEIKSLPFSKDFSVRGDPELTIDAATPLSRPAANKLSFIRPDKEVTSGLAAALTGMAIVCTAKTAEDLDENTTAIIADEPRLVFMRILSALFAPSRPGPGIHSTAVIATDSRISPTAHIGAGCVIGADCDIGEHTVIHPNVTLYRSVKIGRSSTVNSGTVIGADGFGYEKNIDGTYEKFPHLGGVIIGDDVEIGSNTSVDRGTLGDTVICDRVKIDNQCHISHNAFLDEDCMIIAQSMIAGSVEIGKGAWVAPSASVLNQISVGDGATVGIGALVVKDVEAGATVMGAPAEPLTSFLSKRRALQKIFEAADAEEDDA